jgi:hypothetical protein
VVQATDFWNLDNLPGLSALNVTRLRAIHVQRQMRASAVVVGEVAPQYPPQMVLVQHDDMVQTLAADAADQAFGIGILPGTPGGLSSPPRCPYRVSDPESASRTRRPDPSAGSGVLRPRGRLPRSVGRVHSAVGCSVTPKCTTRRRWWRITTSTNSTLNLTVGTTKKSMATKSLAWLFRNARQVGEGDLRRRRMYLRTVSSATTIPSFSSSPAMRGAPHPELARDIRRMSCLTSTGIAGRPGFCLRLSLAQCSLHLRRCHLMTAAGCTKTSASCQPHQGGEPGPEEAIGRLEAGLGGRPLVDGELVAQGQDLELYGAPRVEGKQE